MGEDMTPAGLCGKIFFCAAEDLKKNPDALMHEIDEPVTIKPGMLTYEGDNLYKNPKGFHTTFTGTVAAHDAEQAERLLGTSRRVNVTIERKPGKLPRKMKKAYRSDYPRNTKWVRKVANYIKRNLHTLHDAEIVITREQQARISVQVNAELTITDRQSE